MKTDTHDRTFDEEPSFDDLQPYFDEQARRIAAILDSPEVKPLTINMSAATTKHRRILRAWRVSALFFLAVSIYWGVALWHLADDTYLRIFSVILEAVFLVISIRSIFTVISILRCSPHRRRDTRACLRPVKSGSRSFVVNLERFVSLGVAASSVILLVSCTTTIGDGYVLTKNKHHDTRIETVENVADVLNQIRHK